jgi:hypothetical protein
LIWRKASSTTRAALASAGAYLFIAVHFDFHTGDLNPFRPVPMLGTHKPRRDNHYQPFSFDDFPQLQPSPRDRRAPPLLVVDVLIAR